MAKAFKILFTIYIIGFTLCLTLIIFMPGGCHLRWNLGYVIAYITILTGILSFILSFLKKTNPLLKFFIGIFSICVLIFIIYPATRPFLIPEKCYGGDNGYIIKKRKAILIDPDMIILYKVSGLLEKEEKTIYSSFFVEDISDISVRTDISAIIMNIHDSEKGKITSSKCIFPIDEDVFDKNLKTIQEIAKKESLEIVDI